MTLGILHPHVSEADLLRRTGQPLRIENCSCGGQIAGLFNDWQDIAEALRTHQQGERHAAYRERMGFVEAWL